MSEKKLIVDILGKGKEKVTITDSTTIGELRTILNLDSDVRAYNENNKKIKENENLSNTKKVSFIHNIEGGNQV